MQGARNVGETIRKTLNDFGVTEIEAQGKPFDPYFHEAVMQIASEDLEDDTVAVVLKKGYMYKDTVLRPASVQVSHKP
ncbi:MAG: nucleotide exchange factor GrpE [Dialister sp.]